MFETLVYRILFICRHNHKVNIQSMNVVGGSALEAELLDYEKYECVPHRILFGSELCERLSDFRFKYYILLFSDVCLLKANRKLLCHLPSNHLISSVTRRFGSWSMVGIVFAHFVYSWPRIFNKKTKTPAHFFPVGGNIWSVCLCIHMWCSSVLYGQ